MRISDWSSDVCSSDLFFQKHPELVGNGRRFFLKHGPYSILLARFLGPLRAVTPSLAAASGMRFWLFACTDAIAAFAWVCAFIMPGVAFGASLGLADRKRVV